MGKTFFYVQPFTRSHAPVFRFVSLSSSIPLEQPCMIIIKEKTLNGKS